MKKLLFSQVRKTSIAAFACILFTLSCSSLFANTYNVTSTTDHPITGAGISVNGTTGVITGGSGNGLVTIRSAAAAANTIPAGPHTINIPAGTYNLTIAGTGEGLSPAIVGIGDIDITANNVTVRGATMNTTIIHQNTGIDRLFDVNVNFIPDFNFTMDSLTLSGGREQTGNGGGAMFTGSSNNLGTVTVRNVKFDDNQAFQAPSFLGNGLGGGGFQHQGGNLVLTGCIFNNNSTTKSGGGLCAFGFRDLPIALPIVFCTFTITNCTFTNNTCGGASGGGGADLFGMNLSGVNATVTGCLFSGNTSTASGGGGIVNESINLTATECTFLNNQANNGGAVYGAGGSTNISFCRLIGNNATANGDGFASPGSSEVFIGNNNWWGVNTGPAANGATGSTMQVTKWLRFTHTPNPTSVVVSPPGSSTLTASFLTNSANEAISTADLSQIIGLPILFNNAVQGTLSNIQTTIQPSATATATYTVLATACPPSGSANATVDNGTVTATITIIDNIPPTVTCPVNKTVNNEVNLCGKSVALDAVANDNCPGSFVNYTVGGAPITSPHFFPVGLTTVVARAQDASGNLSVGTCSFTVTVNDVQPPTITCTTNKTVNTDAGVCTYTHSGTAWNATGTDNCPTINFAYSLSGATTGSGTSLNTQVFQKGVTTVQWTATDGSNNTNTCSFTVTVNDIQAPTITCTTNQTVNVNAGVCTYTHSGTTWNATGTDNCPILNFAYALSGATTGNGTSLNTQVFQKGITTVQWTATDGSSNTATCSFTVTVNDIQPPTVTCPANKVVSNDAGLCSASVTLDAVANDNCPGSFVNYTVNASPISNPFVFPSGITTVVAQAQDASGNLSTSTCSFTVTVNDTEVPTINCTSNKTENVAAGLCTYTHSGIAWDATGSDNCTTINFAYSLSGATTGSGTSLNTQVFQKGVTTVQWTATDGSSNTNTCSFTVTVNDIQPPTITCTSNQTENVTAGMCTHTHSGTAWDATGSDNCTTINFAYSLSGATTGTGTSLNGVAFNGGVTTVQWIATDGSSNTATCSFTVTVNDSEVPTVSCPANKVVSNDAGLCSASVLLDAVANDNCPGAFVNYTVNASPITNPFVFSSGITTVVAQAQDAAGNLSTSTCSFTVTVNDTQAPTITCTTNKTVNTDASICSYAHSGTAWDATGSDNCTTVNFAYSLSGVTTGTGTSLNGQVFQKGVTTVVWTATDGSNNTNTCSFTVTVNDIQVPIITCASNQIVNTDAAVCTYTHSGITWDAAGSDNCTTISFAYSLSGVTTGTGTSLDGETFNKGVTTVQWTATDGSNNTATCSFTVTVNDMQAPTITCPSNVVVVEDPPGSGSKVVLLTSLGTPTTSDNCPGETSQLFGVPAGNVYPIGITTLTYTVADASNNTATCTQTVTVNPACQITCPGNVTATAELNLCGATVTYSAATTTGNCGTLTYSHPSGSFFNVGMTTVIVSSASTGQSCSFTVTVNDLQPPQITCPSTQTLVLNAACSATLPDYTSLASATDNCTPEGLMGVTQSPLPGSSVSGTGIFTVTLMVTDASANTSTCTFNVTKVDNTPPTISCPANQIAIYNPAVCGAVVTGIDATFSDNCSGTSVAYQLTGATTGSGSGNASGQTFSSGVTTVIYTATDGSSNTATCSFTVTVNAVTTVTTLSIAPTTQQYSDTVRFVASILNGLGSCDQAADSVRFFVGSQLMGTVPLLSSGSNLVGTLTAPLLESIAGTMSPGVKTVSAQFVNVNSHYIVNSPTPTSLTVTKENALLTYNGFEYFSTASPNSCTGTIVLSAAVIDSTDNYRGDIRKATVTFKDETGAPVVLGTPNVPVTLINPAIQYEGFATTSFNYTLNNTECTNTGGHLFEVWTYADNYYTGKSAQATLVTLAVPGQNRVSAGGQITLSNSAGCYAATAGTKMNFGATLKFNNSGNNVQGQVTILFRRMVSNVLRTYKIKSNSITSVSVQTSGQYKVAYVITKATLTDVTNPNNPIAQGGNLTLNLQLWDNTTINGGSTDKIAVTLTGNASACNGLLFSSSWSGVTTVPQIINGGNVNINSNGNKLAQEQSEENSFEIIAYPNPASQIINISFLSETDASYSLRLVNITGQILLSEMKQATAGENNFTVDLSDFAPGIYTVLLQSGDNLAQTRIMKQE